MALTRLAALFVLLWSASIRADANALASRAWELYVGADYESALDVLGAADDEALSPSDLQTVREYRALCLIALARIDDAARVITQMIDADPFYAIDRTQRPPRFVAMFTDLRRERLEMLGHDGYMRAVLAFDEHRYRDAETALVDVLRLAEHAAAEPAGDRDNAWLSLLKSRATQFLAAARSYTAAPATSRATERGYFETGDAGVTPALPLSQDIPEWTGAGASAADGQLALVINASGDVREATLLTSIHPTYDALIVKAARSWKFQPAMRDGRPVSFRTVMTIRISPQRRLS